jgi:hypothetical protein
MEWSLGKDSYSVKENFPEMTSGRKKTRSRRVRLRFEGLRGAGSVVLDLGQAPAQAHGGIDCSRRVDLIDAGHGGVFFLVAGAVAECHGHNLSPARFVCQCLQNLRCVTTPVLD